MDENEHFEALGFTLRVHGRTRVAALVPPLCTVPAGPFTMGSETDFSPFYPQQFPEHEVTLPAYTIGRYPVTVAEYAYALAAGAKGVCEPVNWPLQRDASLNPVSGLTWYDALAYARWLSEQTGESWRLPSEAEWEKAARGTARWYYPWGNRWDPERANACEAKTGGMPLGSRPMGSTTSVDAYPLGSSPYGLMDLIGNIEQWTSTIWDPERFTHPYRPDDGREDLSVEARLRVTRGGCWLYPLAYLRADCRQMFHTSDRFDWLLGVRLVRDSGSL